MAATFAAGKEGTTGLPRVRLKIMNAPLVDVIIPNRNKVQYLPATLASLLGQTEARWRAIVIDGESSDGSAELLRAASEKDARIHVRSATPTASMGLTMYRSWNHGLLGVRAPYYAVLTSDDLWEPTWLERAVRGLDEHPSAIAAAARAICISASGVVEGPTQACRQFEGSFSLSEGRGYAVLPSNSCVLRSLLFGPVFSTIHSMVFRRRVLEEGVIFAEDVGYLADIEYYLHTCMLGDIVYDQDSRALFRLYPEQASSEAKGRGVSELWGKVVRRNRDLVARRLGIPTQEMRRVTEEILARHQFVMTKPDKNTIRRSKISAALKMLRACFGSPRLAVDYLKCRASKDRFLADSSAKMAKRMAAAHAFS